MVDVLNMLCCYCFVEIVMCVCIWVFMGMNEIDFMVLCFFFWE